MKKLLLILALLASIPMFAERVDPETARKVATTFLSNNGAKSTELTDLSKAAGFANLYIFTTDESFVVMAADDCVKPILGYSFTGNFETEGMPENISSWLQGYSDEIQYAVDHQQKAMAEDAQKWNDLIAGNRDAGKTNEVVPALIETKWNQNGYGNVYLFNNLCPEVASGGHGGHAFTGCVATAMAQIMKYWQYPTKGIGYHSYNWNNLTLSVDFGSTTYDWPNMTKTYSSTSTDIEKLAVDVLMYHCGVSVNMNYGGNGSNASTNSVLTALQTYFNYSSAMHYEYKSDYSDEDWIALVKAELNEERPLQYRGSGDGGHSFVCDGYNSDSYFHFNWGWAGSCDGYYPLDDLTTTNPGTGGGNGSYTNDQQAIFGIQPSEITIDAPSDLSYSLEGLHNVTLSWTPVSGAVSYNVYCNNLQIGNTESNTYSDVAPFGTVSYYVRSVGPNNELSLSSNTVTLNIDYQTPVVEDLTVTVLNNNASFAWTAPEWCYPETPSTTLTYGSNNYKGSLGYNNPQLKLYWGHCYPMSSLSSYENMAIYKVAFYAAMAGTYKIVIYQGTTSDLPSSKIVEQACSVNALGWIDIELSKAQNLDITQDLWVFLYDPEGKDYPASYSDYSGDNGNYYSSDPTSYIYSQTNIAFLIRTYLTDGTYTYNLYQDNEKIAENLTETTYADATLKDNAPNLFQVTTNYYGGEAPSNKIGFAKGNANFEGALTLGDNDKMTVTEGSALTVTGNLSNDNAANLVIENGAQLIHHSDDVMATYQKDIAGYIGDGGWFTIAIPFASYTPTGSMISSEYDLYAYIENGAKEWDNYKDESFDLYRRYGYLYAHNPGITLNITGTLNNGDYTETVDLSYGNTNADLRGYNLLGNPTAHDITFTKTEKVSDGYYYLDNSENWVYADNNIVPAGRGFLVKANAENQTVTLNPQSKNGDGDGETQGLASLQIDVDGASVYVKMTDGVSMPLLSFKGKSQGLYLSQNGKPYVMLVKGDNDNLSLHYKARENGTHTIHLSPLTFNFSPLTYLHLIDNLTGADIDLLKTPSYTFESQATDYEARFQLVFRENANPSEDSDVFAYYADGYIHLLGIHDNATIQVIDATGRVIANTTTRTLTTTGWAPGVYIIRLMDENFIKTQKIIINK